MSEELQSLRHDLRTPLQTILSAAFVIKTNSDKTTPMLEMIQNAVNQAIEILEDPLNVVSPKEIQFSLFVEEILKKTIVPENIETIIQNKHEQFFFDSVKMKRVLNNLVKNAIEAMTPDGGKLFIKTIKQGGYNIIMVTDTGPGIPASMIKSIFMTQHTTKEDGHGQGLISCRQIVTAHKGTITVNNNIDGPGVAFIISLPTYQCSQQKTDELFLFKKKVQRWTY